MKKDLLPLGSVVLLKGANKRIVICGRIQACGGEKPIIYDYSACYYPEGIMNPKDMLFFDHDAIEQVFYKGFEDEEELSFRQNVLGQLGELEVRDGKIVPKE